MMPMILDFPQEIETALHRAADRLGQPAEEYAAALITDQLRLLLHQPVDFEGWLQRITALKLRDLPLGSNGMDQIIGQWPGDETTEELLAALKQMG
jgi:hypothetical protein